MLVQGIALGGNSVTVDLAVVTRRVEINLLDYVQDRSWHNFSIVWVQRLEPINDLPGLLPRKRFDGLPTVRHTIGPPRQGTNRPRSEETIAIESVSHIR
jgi:hypothetical protein